jgi:hypothetical protein
MGGLFGRVPSGVNRPVFGRGQLRRDRGFVLWYPVRFGGM